MTPADICNLAFDQIGVTTSIQSVSPPIPPAALAAQVAGRNYQNVVDQVIRAAHWNCCRVQRSLSLLKAAPGTPENPSGTALPPSPFPWLYSYALPADCLKMRFLFPGAALSVGGTPLMTNQQQAAGLDLFSAAAPFVPAIDFDANNNQIAVVLTNVEAATAVYSGRIGNPDLWDAGLRNAIIATLAAWFVNPLARNKELLGERVQIAKALVEQARISDGNEGATSTDSLPDWFLARGGSPGEWGVCGPGRGFLLGYDALSFPTGLTV